MIALGCTATLFAPSFSLVSLSLMILWMGFGFFEVGTNALATTVFKKNTAIYMNLMHFFYGFGAVLGPQLAATAVTKWDVGYKGIYLITLFPVLLILGFICLTKFDIASAEDEPRPTMTIASGLRNKYVWLFALALGFLEVIEFGAANWGAFFLKDAYGLSPLTMGAAFVSAYYIFFTLSRLLSGFAIEKIGYARSMIIGLVGIFLLFLSGFLLGPKGIPLLALTGFFVAIMWPTLMCVAMTVFKVDAPIATSIIIVLSGAINGMMQFITGLINEYISPTLGYKLNMFYIFIPLIIISILFRRFEKPKK